MRQQFRGPVLLCFSPPVMIATIVIELALALWVFSRFALGTSRRLIVVILACLAAFQLAEFNVCGSTTPDLIWSRIGYVFITLLPPLALHLIMRLRRGRWRPLVAVSYVVGSAFALAFVFLPTALNRGICAGNYVIFRLAQPLSDYYSYYYMGLVALGLVMAFWPTKSLGARRRSALRWTAIGYIAFTLPTVIITYLLPFTRLGIPSIMCGFAVILAIIFGLKVAPLADDRA
jgi:hypothetical protein